MPLASLRLDYLNKNYLKRALANLAAPQGFIPCTNLFSFSSNPRAEYVNKEYIGLNIKVPLASLL